ASLPERNRRWRKSHHNKNLTAPRPQGCEDWETDSSADRRLTDRQLVIGIQIGSTSMYTLKLPICIPMTNWRSVNRRSALESVSQSSHPCGRGAVRFLLWWLFLHRRLRSGNEAQLSLSRF